MKKKPVHSWSSAFFRLLHIPYGAKLTILFVCLNVFQSFAGISQATKIQIRMRNASLKEVLKEVERQSNFRFIYNDSRINVSQKVSVDSRGENIREILDQLFKNTNLSYSIEDKLVILNENRKNISPKPVPPSGKFKVEGTVTGKDGLSLPGVTVTIKGIPGGTVTSEEGKYLLSGVSENSILVFSFIGMQTKEVKVGKQTKINVILSESSIGLGEVVAVGYGSQRKETVTGSISSVKMNDMRTPVRSLTNALAGKVAGIISMQTSGEPGYDNANFTIRGIGTFTGNNSPLIIIDGVQRDDTNSTYAGAYNNIDTEDIESISLLKDASATAVYGAKGANGVLIITTKKGAVGKPKISLKAESGISGFTQLPKMIDGTTYMKLYNEAKQNMGDAPLYSNETIQKTASGLDPYLYPNVDWIKSIYKSFSQMYNVNVNVSGGTEAVRYYMSMSFYDQEGNYKVSNLNGYDPNLNFQRYDFRSNVDVNLTHSTILSLNLAAMLVDSRYPGISSGSLWYSAYATNPISFPIQYPGGKWAGPMNNGGNNPKNDVQNSGYTTEFRPTMQSIFTLKQDLAGITKGLSALGRFSFDSYGESDNGRSGYNDLWYAGSRDGDGNLVFTRSRVGQQNLGYSQYSSAERTMYLEANLGYDRAFGDHNVRGMLLYNMRNRIQGTAGDVIASIPYRNQGLAARAMYSYLDKYLFEANAGYTGSENFASGHRFGFFPAVSAGWVISKEGFFQPLVKGINLLKLRGSLGRVGNDQIGGGSRFPYLTQIGGSTGASFGYNGTYYGGLQENILGVQNLTWETSTKADVGIELGLLNKFNIVVDAYQDKRKDILISRGSISPIAGYSNLSIFANMGEMNNKGIDGSLEYNDKFGKDGWIRMFGNFTYSHNKIVFQDEPVRQLAYQQGTGHMFGEYTGYISQGLFKDQEDIDKSPRQSFSVTHPGDIKYQDMNNDGVIDASDWTYLGKSSFPTWSYGLGTSVGYKKFDVSVFFQGVTDVGIMANGSSIQGVSGTASGVGIVPFTGNGQYPGNMLSNVTSRWTVDNPSQDVDYPRLSIASQNDNNYQSSTWWLKDGSFCRLKQASLGYTITSPSSKRNGWSSLYFYLSGQNLLTFTKFKLWDPELGSNGAKYPLARTITLGIRVQF
ncbi:MAG: SusC/RagA family TonB-linked outer membrane protein [Bacteroidota bacterium]|nr:SusC/RagA family TonB-linked outer membrane protein [Bacteroidota bacterium]